MIKLDLGSSTTNNYRNVTDSAAIVYEMCLYDAVWHLSNTNSKFISKLLQTCLSLMNGNSKIEMLINLSELANAIPFIYDEIVISLSEEIIDKGQKKEKITPTIKGFKIDETNNNWDDLDLIN